MKRRILICALGVFAMLALAAGILIYPFIALSRQHEVAMLQVEQHLASHQAELNDAVLAVAAANPQGGKPAVESLPVALRTPGILAVMVSDRHITLDVTHNPDTTRGFRIWAGTPDRDFDDKPTAIPGVYRFVYCNDYPESPKNRPD